MILNSRLSQERCLDDDTKLTLNYALGFSVDWETDEGSDAGKVAVRVPG